MNRKRTKNSIQINNHRSCHLPRATSFFLRRAAIALILAWLAATLLAPAARAEAPPRPTVLRADDTGVTMRWQFPAVTIATRTADGRTFAVISLNTLPADGAPGTPILPHATALIGLPPTGGATLKIIAAQTETITLPAPPLPAVSLFPLGSPPRAAEKYLPDPALYATDVPFPARPAELSAPVQIRRRRVARLTLNPVRVNPVARTATILRAVTIQILFDDVPPRVGNIAAPPTDPITNLFGEMIVNPAAARWQLPRESAVTRVPAAASAAPEIKITVPNRGLFALSCADIQSAGLDAATLDPRHLQLTVGYPRQPVAVWLPGESDGQCDPADRLFFFADPAYSRTTDDGVYFLSVGQGDGARMATQAGDPAGLSDGTVWLTATAEENNFYEELYPDHAGDRWFWKKLDALTDPNPSLQFSIMSANPQPSSTAELTLWVQGKSAETHRVRVSINGQIITEAVWDGRTAHTITAAVNGGILQNGQNTVTVTVIDGVSAIWVDAAALRYAAQPTGGGQILFAGEASPRAYTLSDRQNPIVLDVTRPLTPTRVTGATLSGAGTLTFGDGGTVPARYLVASGAAIPAPKAIQPAQTLPDPPGGADVIIITHPDFAAPVASLAAYRAAQGWRVVTVDVTAIYDAFGDGRVSAEAIKTFLAHAFAAWTAPAPAFVLLVGDGSYDFKNYAGWGNPNFIPPYLSPVDPRNFFPWSAETAADNRYVTLTGDDNFPDMLIGRLPVNSAAEAATVVDKILRYEKTPLPGDWNMRQLFVSDNCDSAGNFYAAADAALNRLSPPMQGVRYYYPQDSGAPCAYNDALLYNSISSLRANFLQAFSAGAGMVTFHGHSSWHQWAGGNRINGGAEESVFHWSANPAENDVARLTNGYRLPVVLEMTCFTGYFQHPEYPTLDESLLRRAGGGAVAVWGATGLGVATGHSQLQAGFYDALITNGERNLGAAVLSGKAKLFANGFNQDLLDTFTLLGDPAMTMDFTERPFTEFVYLPLVAR